MSSLLSTLHDKENKNEEELEKEFWRNLRNDFFDECTDEAQGRMKKINFAPHDMFEWFRKRLENKIKL